MPTPSNIISFDFKLRQLRQLEGRVVEEHLALYAEEELPKEVIQYALSDFLPEDLPEALDEEVLFEYLFIPWFLFNWIPADDFGIKGFAPDKTIAQNYMAAHGDRLSSQERRFLEAINQSFYSYYSILDVKIGQSLLVKDILLGTTHTIKEQAGTYQLKRGDIVFSRILTLDDHSIFVGMAPFNVPVRYQTNLIDFRKWLTEQNHEAPLTPRVLRDKTEELLGYFFYVMERAFANPFPQLANTDGDPFEFSKSYFQLTLSPEEALSLLLPMTLSDDPEDILQNAKRDKSGKIKQITFSWLGQGNKMHKSWDNTVLGHITINPGRLTLETNSQERTRLGKELLAKYLREGLAFQKTLIETPEQKMKSVPPPRPGEEEEARKMLALPKVQEQLKAMAREHWEGWFDEPIPALEGKTPREAARTQEGRERLEALLLQYERYNAERENDPFKADIPYLRGELRLDT